MIEKTPSHLMRRLKGFFGPIGACGVDRSGSATILTALGSTVLIGVVGLGVDVGVWHHNHRKIQGAADQAAFAAALASAAEADITAEAKAISASFGLVDGQSGVTVTVNRPPTQGSHTHNSSAIEVVISELQPQYLSRLVLPQAPTATGRAVAVPGGPGTMCVMALDTSGKLAVESVDLDGGATVTLTTCDLYNNSGNSDSTDVSGNSALTARNIYLSGSYQVGGSGAMTALQRLETYQTAMPDPYSYLEPPTYSGCDQNNYKLNASKTDTINPGVYCGGIDVEGGATLTLKAGTYILDRGSLTIKGNATVTGSGVTIFLGSSTGANFGSITINGGATVTLSAPAAGASLGIPGIAIWEDVDAPVGTAKFDGGSTQNINGAMYLPSQQADFAGGSSSGTSCSQLVALTVTFSGNAYFQHSCGNAGVSEPPSPPIIGE
jgi:Flp pilus assembly protein TadG